MSIYICSCCTAAVSNDDWTVLDFQFSPEQAQREFERRSKAVARLGLLGIIGPVVDEYEIDCAVCDRVVDCEDTATPPPVAWLVYVNAPNTMSTVEVTS